MKIKTDFVTNSSSTCYIFDRKKLTKEENNLLTLVRKECVSAELNDVCMVIKGQFSLNELLESPKFENVTMSQLEELLYEKCAEHFYFDG